MGIPSTTSEAPLTFRPGASIRERLTAAARNACTGQSRIVNAALSEFLDKHRTPEAVINALGAYHLRQLKAKRRTA